jgi:uncharacterized protein (TIGR02646 family)
MVRIESVELPPRAELGLKRYQAEVNSERDYARRVEVAAVKFATYNRATNSVFDGVRRTLDAMCSGARRCMYCEDSAADEVEHHHPKNLYPDLVFVWENYLYACGPCNGPKSNRFAIFRGDELQEIGRGRRSPVSRPPAGNSALLDPRTEDPLGYLMLDIAGNTFRFVSLAEPGSRAAKRAEYTLDVLGLNRRELLPRARREAYLSYRARIVEFGHKRDGGANEKELTLLIDALGNMQHPTVFHEMRRQRELVPELKKLFKKVPEALNW